jgi:hypothetical protein
MCWECFQPGASVDSFTGIENSGRIAFEGLSKKASV